MVVIYLFVYIIDISSLWVFDMNRRIQDQDERCINVYSDMKY